MRETVLEFGPSRRLIGVLTRPDASQGAGHGLTVLITNSGIIHRVGPNRLHVRLARALAARGIPCLRYDLPGVGDSERLATGGDVASENVRATAAAIDALGAAGVGGRFVIIGLCSGADHGFQAACADARLAGAVLIDPTAMFSTTRHRAMLGLRALRRATRPALWLRVLSGRYRLRNSNLDEFLREAGPGAPRSLRREEHPDAWKQTRDAFQSLIDRQTQLLLLITRHNQSVYSYRRQLQDAFPDLRSLDGILQTDRRPQSDHTFSAESDRAYLESTVIRWLTERMLPSLPRVQASPPG